jgi:two-component system cell cycle sensor histidine kinase/response regulator CckA
MLRRRLTRVIRAVSRPLDAHALLAKGAHRSGLLLDALTAVRDEDLLRWTVSHLGRTLEVSCVFVGELCGDAWERVRTLAVFRDGRIAENFTYASGGSPCGEALARGTPLQAQRLSSTFPGTVLTTHLRAEDYVGLPLRDDAGRPLGILAAVSDAALPRPRLVTAALELLAPRVTRVLELRRALWERDLLIECTAQPSSDETFRSLVRALAHTQHVKVAFVSEVVDARATRARTLAICEDGALRDNFEYPLEGTPCALVYEHAVVFHPRDARRLYPDDPYFAAVGAEAYLGMAFVSAAGTPIGHVGVVHDRPLADGFASQTLLRAFVARAGAELARRHAEEDRLAMERQLLEAQRTDSLGVLAGGIAHDFNNLLVGITGNVSLALADCRAPSAMRTRLTEIDGAARRAADLARQMLAYAGRGQLTLEPLDLTALVEEMTQLLHVSTAKKATLQYRFAAGLPSVRADATQIRQVVMNLVLNASEAIGDGPGVVTVTTGFMCAERSHLADLCVGRELPPGNYVFLSVADTGCGMDPATLRRIFDPFFTTRVAGRGLGLAAVHGIVLGHGGGLGVRTAVGRGSSFTLLLPPAGGTATDAPGPPPSTDVWKGHGLVLVVDDEETVRATTGLMVERLGFEVALAADAHEALDIFRRRGDGVRAVLLDLSMPGMTGEQALHELRAIRPEARVILMSGYDSADVIRRFRTGELAGFLQKPFRLEDLKARLREAVGLA